MGSRPSVVGDSPEQMLEFAKDLAGRWEPGFRRASAILARTAIEQRCRELISADPNRRTGMKTSFIVLRLTQPQQAFRGHHLWSVLSRIAHHSESDLIPGPTEMAHWVEQATEWAAAE